MKNRNELVSVIAVFCCLMIAFHTCLVSAAEQSEKSPIAIKTPISMALAGAGEAIVDVQDSVLEQTKGGEGVFGGALGMLQFIIMQTGASIIISELSKPSPKSQLSAPTYWLRLSR